MTYTPKQAFGLKIKLRTATGSDAVKAEKTHGTSNAKLHFVAKTAGADGNSITVAMVNPGTNTTLSVAVVGTAITVTLGYSASAIDSKANDVIAAIYASAAAAALIDVDNSDGDGTGTVTALSVSNLTGGADATHTFEEIPGIGDVSIPGLNRQSLDFTSHSSTGGYAEKVKDSIKDGREFTIPLKYDPTNTIHQALKAEEASDNESVMQFVFPYLGADFQCNVLVLDFPTENPVRGLIMTNVKCELVGAPTSI